MPSPSQPTLIGFSTDTGMIGDERTTDRMLTFFGTGQAGASLEVRNAVTGSTIAFLPLIPASGNWSVTSTISLPNGDYIFNTASRDVNDGQPSSLSADFPLTIEGAQVLDIDLLSDTGTNTTDDITADATPDIRFTAGDGDTLSIDWGDGNGFVSAGLGTGSAQTFTAPGYTAPFSNDQQITITVRAQNGATTVDEQFTFTLDRDQIFPGFTLDPSSDSGTVGDRITNDATPTINGVAEEGATIRLSFGNGAGTVFETILVGPSGNWTATLPTVPGEGLVGIVANSVDRAGNSFQNNSSLRFDTIIPDAPTINSTISLDSGVVGDRITNDNRIFLSGTVESPTNNVSTIVRIYDGGMLIGTDTTTFGGTWGLTTNALADGVYNLTAEAVDPAGSISVRSSALNVTIDTTAPGAPTIDLNAASDSGSSATDNITRNTTPTISGTAEANATITIRDGAAVLGTTTANGAGAWSFTTGTLSPGAHNLTARATDVADNTGADSAVLAITIDTVAPNTPTVTGFSDDTGTPGDGITADTSPTLTGTAESGVTAQILRDGSVVGTVTANGSGAWSYTSPDLAPASYSFVARAVDAAGNTSGSSDSFSLSIAQGVTGQPIVTGISTDTGISDSDGITNDQSLRISGTAENNATVEMFLNGSKIGEAVASSSSGAWTFDYTGTTLDEGDYAITAIASASGKGPSVSSAVFDVIVDLTAPTEVPVVTNITQDTGIDGDFVTSDRTFAFSGTATPGTLTLVIFDAGSGLYTSPPTETDESGTWTYDFSGISIGGQAGFPDGAYQVHAQAVDAAGNRGPSSTPIPVIIDTEAPLTPVITGFSDDTGTVGDNVTSDTTLTLTGTAEVGASVVLQIDGNAMATVTTDENGDWSYTTPGLANATYAFTAKAVDRAGNESAVTQATTITVELLATQVPVVSSISTDTGVSANDGVTNDTTLVISGTSEASASVEVFLDETSIGTVLANGSGVWSFDYTGTTLTEGTYALTARATLSGSDPSAVSAGFNITLDATAPAAPTIDLDASSDLGTLDNDNLTSDTTPTLTGTAEANATVEVFNGSTSLGTTSANGAGAWSLTTPVFAEGVYSLTARASDVAGNTGPSSAAQSVTIDTTGPVIGVIALDSGSNSGRFNYDDVTNDTTPTFNFTVTGEALVEIDWKDGRGYQVIENTGSATQDLPYADGSYTPTVRATDAAGNVTTRDAVFAYTFDTTPPAAPTAVESFDDAGLSDNDRITNNLDITFSGTASEGTINMERNGVFAFSSLVEGGVWTFDYKNLVSDGITLSDFVPDGEQTFVFYTEDQAGNRTDAAPITVTFDTVAPAVPTLDLIASDDTGRSDKDNYTSGVPNGFGGNSFTLTGTAEVGTKVELLSVGGFTTPQTVGEDGSVIITFVSNDPTPAFFTRTFALRSTDVAGNVSTSEELTVVFDTVPPDAPVITSFNEDTPPVGDGITRDATPTLIGTAEPDAIVTVFQNGTPIGTALASSDASWSYDVPQQQLGQYAFTATATDIAGNTSAVGDAFNIEIQSNATDVPVVTAVTDDTGADGFDGVTNDTTLLISGTAKANASVEVFINNMSIGSVDANSGGVWVFDYTGTPLAQGSYAIKATAIVSGEEVSGASPAFEVIVDTTAPTTPTIDLNVSSDTGASTTDNITNDATPTVTVNVEGATRVEIFDGAISLGAAVEGDAGVWTFNAPTLTDGTHNLTAQASDVAGNLAVSLPLVLSIDTLAPQAPTIRLDTASDTGFLQTDNITRDNTPTLTGTAEAGARIDVYNGDALIGTTVTDNTGAWSYTLSQLPDTQFALTARATDTAGNQSAISAPLALIVDTAPPTGTTIQLVADSDSGVLDDGVTNDNTPAFTGLAEAGARVDILQGGTLVGTVLANQTGDWSFQSVALPVGGYSFTGRATDLAGNVSPQTNALSLQIQPIVGSVPVIVSITQDTGRLATDGITSDATPTINGTGIPGQMVTVYLADQMLGTAEVTESGQWSLDYQGPALADGNYEVTATSTPPDGVASERSTAFGATIDTVAPSLSAPNLTPASDSGALQTDGLTNIATPTISFTAENGADLAIDWGDGAGFVAAGQAVGAEQKLTLGTYYASDGLKTVQVRATDAAGNVSVTSTTLTLDTATPAPGIVLGLAADTGTVGDAITSDQRLVFNGASDPGTVLAVLLDGTKIGEVVADRNGVWSFDYTQVALAAGVYGLSVSATSVAGNTAPPSDRFEFTVLDLASYQIVLKQISPAQSYEVGTVIAQLDVENQMGPATYQLSDTLNGAITIDGDKIVISGPFDPSVFPSLLVSVTATVLGGEQVSGSVDLIDFVNVEYTGADGIVRGGPADETINGTGTDDIIFGGFGDDLIEGGSGADDINGGAGNDTLTDRDGNGIIDGGDGDDVILAMNGTNILLGGNGNDLLLGGLGEDRLEGGSGNDVLKSDRSISIGGRDHLDGGTGNDLLEGGVGADTFVFRPNDGNDAIGKINIDFSNLQLSVVAGADFQSGVDRIALINFGYTDSAEAFSHLSDVNGQATFQDQGLTLHFAGLSVADLASTDFFIF
jgi:hypothetical protein